SQRKIEFSQSCWRDLASEVHCEQISGGHHNCVTTHLSELADLLRPLLEEGCENAKRTWRTNSREKARIPETLTEVAPPVPLRPSVSFPNPLFDARWYLAQYPDVRESSFDPFDHFMRYGASEGRNPNAFFDTSWYLANNPDVRASGMNPLDHYLRYGAAEGRKPGPTSDLPSNINPFFDAQWYLAQYSDVCESSFDPFDHFMRYGASEG